METLMETKVAQIILVSLTWDQPKQFPPALSTGQMWIHWTLDTASVEQYFLCKHWPTEASTTVRDTRIMYLSTLSSAPGYSLSHANPFNSNQ